MADFRGRLVPVVRLMGRSIPQFKLPTPDRPGALFTITREPIAGDGTQDPSPMASVFGDQLWVVSARKVLEADVELRVSQNWSQEFDRRCVVFGQIAVHADHRFILRARTAADHDTRIRVEVPQVLAQADCRLVIRPTTSWISDSAQVVAVQQTLDHDLWFRLRYARESLEDLRIEVGEFTNAPADMGLTVYHLLLRTEHVIAVD